MRTQAAYPRRRIAKRIPFRAAAEVEVGDDVHRGYVANLSEWGAFVVAAHPARPGERLSLVVELDGAAACKAAGRVVHVSAVGAERGFGVELTERNYLFANFVYDLENADDEELSARAREIGRIVVTVGSAH